ncbi:hypothetical protein B7494_g7239 [Chlorociboria aeruginascens]|nr:hypothetical protein B7494_g7239 [Chlorociboria aeruginascens]
MDLALLSPQSKPSPESQDSQIPRLLERVLLDLGYGARLLTKTRVPIIKLCEKPTEKLKADLLAERLKWESGFDAENDEEDEDNIKGEIATEEPELTKSQVSKSAEGQESRELSIDTKTSRTGSQESAHAEDLSQEKSERDSEKKVTLKQKDGQSLPDYYSSAKRLLRKLGGRDVSDRAEELTSDEFKILNDVCRAFVAGLSSKELSNKLCRYESISSLFDPSKPPSRRPLIIIWNQIEGERLAMAWDSRPLTEPDDKREFECQGIVDAWQALLAKTEDYTNSQHDNREIYRASERLKKICSLQLMFLEQMPTEEPVQYYGRAQMILDNLKQRHTEAGGDYVTPIVIAHYISGVCNAQIKQILQNSPCGAGSLQAIALSHRILQLAFDYEHALKVGAFDKADITDVEKYVGFLRGRVVAKPDTQAETEAILISKMRNLPDPTQLSPNKPRDRYKDHLEFPKTNIGIQCDINFSAHLAIHNTLLLRCYSHCDPRVKLLILFVKNWAKVRGINTPYRGTLSSYGYVLMVLHYLVNIAQPFVCPNLQIFRREPPPYLSPSEIEAQSVCQGRDVRFWRNETEIKSLADRKMLNHNHDSLGVLLRGFFEYFAVNMPMTTYSCRSFDWGREVLSLRTHGGLLTKVEKGWIGARTTIETRTTAAPRTPSNAPANINKPNAQLDTSSEPTETNPKPAKVTNKKVEEVKEIRHRYLFAIEDPFELDHNVARTVTHGGIVAIRDEFRRAWRIIKNVGREQKEELLDPVLGPAERKSSWEELMDLLHGPVRE